MIEELIRSKSAIATVPFVSAEQEGLANEWYNQLLYPSNPMEENTGINMAVRADFEEVICYAHNGRKELATQFVKTMEASKFQPIEIKLFKKFYHEFKDGELECWLKLSPTNQETGWTFKGIFPLKSALVAIPKGKTANHKDLYIEWYEKQEADACVKVGRAVSSGAYTFIHTELFGSTIGEDLEIYSDLMHHLQIEPLPSPLLNLILEESPEFIEMSFHFGSNGIVRAGLSFTNPSQEFIIKLALVLGKGSSDALGAFEGALGAKKTTTVDIYRTKKGVFADFSY